MGMQVGRQLREVLEAADLNSRLAKPADLACVLDGKVLQLLLRPGRKADLLKLVMQCKARPILSKLNPHRISYIVRHVSWRGLFGEHEANQFHDYHGTLVCGWYCHYLNLKKTARKEELNVRSHLLLKSRSIHA